MNSKESFASQIILEVKGPYFTKHCLRVNIVIIPLSRECKVNEWVDNTGEYILKINASTNQSITTTAKRNLPERTSVAPCKESSKDVCST